MLKFPIKGIKTIDEFNSVVSFLENKIRALNEVKLMIKERIKIDRKYCKDIVADSTVPMNRRRHLLDGFIIDKV